MRERHLLNRIQQQADKIKELEADWLDEHTKGVMKTKEIETMRKMFDWVEFKLKDNPEYQQVKSDIIGGKEEKRMLELKDDIGRELLFYKVEEEIAIETLNETYYLPIDQTKQLIEFLTKQIEGK
jgi:hypothetical protein